MKITIQNIADIVDGKVIGNENLTITNVANIQDAKEGDLSFINGKSFLKYLSTTNASAVLVSQNVQKDNSKLVYIEVDKPQVAFQKIVNKFFMPNFKFKGISSSATIAKSSILEEEVSIGENVFIGENCHVKTGATIYHNSVILNNCIIGENTLIFPNVTIREETKIGNNVIIHPGVVVGADGFGFIPDENGVYQKVPQIGNVVIEDDVEVGANTCIDRAALGTTLIRKGVKLDNFVQIAHNTTIGSNTVFSSQSGIAGSSKIGNNCVVAAQVGIIDHLEVGDNIVIAGQSGVTKSLQTPGVYFGTPAKELKTTLKLEAHIRNLPNYLERIKRMERKISELENQLQTKNEKEV
ncbi:MAG: UDP-3-O-(3-hydroxymyristoyl)glucosamine N-acyltransferase [Melioribacteraceae bacterium]